MSTNNTQSRVKIGDREFLAKDLTLPAGNARDFRSAWFVETGGIVEIDWAKAREDFRATASMVKLTFIMASVELGFLAVEDAVDAAKGNWPASFDDVLAATPAEDRLGAQVTWASLAEVRRNAPILALIGAVKGISAEEFDTMFGYTGE
jgi:hypothetical protein